MRLTVVLPVYNEGEHIEQNVAVISETLKAAQIGASFLLVDDGSTDGTWEALVRLSEASGDVGLIRLSRNFGKESAISAGLLAVRSPFCVVMDSDLQHPPEIIPKMLEKAREGYSIVEGVKSSRGKESPFRGLAARVFYRIINRWSGFDMRNSSDFKLLDEKALAAFRQISESDIFFRGITEWLGLKKAQIPFDVAERSGGKTKYSLFKLFKLAIRALTSFSAAPLFLTNILAAVLFVFAVILGVQTLVMYFTGSAETGFSTVILLILILGSAVLFCLGIIGTYLSRIYDEVKRRPRFIIDEEIHKNDKTGCE